MCILYLSLILRAVVFIIQLSFIVLVVTQGGNAPEDTESVCWSARVLRPESGASTEVCERKLGVLQQFYL